MRNPEGRAYERFCTRPTTCEDFSDLQICSQLRIFGFANLQIVGAKKKEKKSQIRNLQFAIVEIWDSLIRSVTANIEYPYIRNYGTGSPVNSKLRFHSRM